MNAALVIMAAGLGSRYGGNKQVDGVGPNGEVLMEYSIHDAIRAGFTKVVFIVKPEILGLVRTLCGDSLRGKTTRSGKPLEVCYAFQDFESLPAFYTLPAGRTKPFGTTHAVLCARDYVNEPFCVINADDYYGVDAYRAMYEELQRLPRQGRATMVGYLLKNTASLHGTVSRGVCAVEDGEIVGYACETVLFENAEVDNIAVAESCRRRGVGKKLLKKLETEAKERGARVILLEVRVSNAPAMTMYLKEGFKGIYVRPRYYPDGEDAVVMQKEL